MGHIGMFSCRKGESWLWLGGGTDQDPVSWRGRLDMEGLEVVEVVEVISLSCWRLLLSSTAGAWESGVKYSRWS